MLVRLILEDFMAHGRTELELGPGLNVLCGPNNTGKSAVVEALRCLATNPTASLFIRHGATQARVEAHFDDGWRVAWIRRKAYALYELTEPGGQPQVFAKLGRSGVPEEVARVLRLAPVPLDKGEAVDVHLGDQRKPVFLLDRPGSAMADFLASSTESAHLMAMQDRLRDEVRRVKISRRHLEEAKADALASLDGLAGLPGFALATENLGAALDKLAQEAAREPELARTAQRLEQLGAAEKALSAKVRALSALAPAPALAPAAPLAKVAADMALLTRQAQEGGRKIGALAPLSAPPALAPAAGLAMAALAMAQVAAQARALRDALRTLAPLAPPPLLAPAAALSAAARELALASGQAGAARRKAQAMTRLAPPPELAQADRLCALLAQQDALAGRSAAVAAQLRALSPLAPPPSLADPAPLAGLAAGLERLAGQAQAERQALMQRQNALLACQKRIAARLEELGQCPLCGAGLEAARFLDRG